MCDHHNRKGITLENQKEHEKDHKTWSRRSFLTSLGVAGGVSMSLGGVPLAADMLSPLQNMLLNCQEDRALVLIRLKGGNDGINTVIPLEYYDHYRNVRPTLGFQENELFNLNDKAAIPSYLQSFLEPMWAKGDLGIVTSVGYDDQNLSHFRSSDIWASGSDEDEVLNTGIFGRYFQSTNPDYLSNPPERPLAIQIGGFSNLLFDGSFSEGNTNLAMSVTDPDQLYQIAKSGQLYNATDLPDDCHYGAQIGYMRTVSNSVFSYAGKIKEAYDASEGQSSNNYQNDELGRQLSIVSRLIKGQLGTKIYMVQIGGFDTHANQKDDHQRLLTSVAANVKIFMDDLEADNMDKQVLAMTFSEFGRRIEENGSLGTDHGASAPLLFFGGEIGPSHFIGDMPNIQQPDPYGNLPYQFDFRQVYATVLENWLGVDPSLVDDVMGGTFPRIDDAIYKCGLNVSTRNVAVNLIDHHVRYGDGGEINIVYSLKGASQVKIDLFSISGQYVTTLSNGNRAEGQHFVPMGGFSRNLPAAQYIYQIQTTAFGNFSGKINRLF